MPYLPHTEQDIKAMLDEIGVNTLEALFDEIPAELHCPDLTGIPDGQNEMMMLKAAERLSLKNNNGLCFLGAGCYEHHIPAAVWDITSRGEFLTAYTPYQAEASQGTLQLLYEFQTMIAELTGLDVANASLYDGASALAEAILMSARLQKNKTQHRVLIPGSLHPFYRDTIQTIVTQHGIELIFLPIDPQSGTLDLTQLEPYASADLSALVIAQPNFFGCLEDVNALTDWAHAHDILTIACVNPTSLGILTPPGQWSKQGADIACGEGQPLGIPMASGGPFFGFLSTRLANVRQLPGRLIGKTVDQAGNPGFALTLQAREQHIRREKATSNICTNQGLLVTAATLYMSLLGAKGLEQVAAVCHQKTLTLVKALTAIPGVEQRFHAPFFHEVVLNLPRSAQSILHALAQKNILGGLDLSPYYPELGNAMLVSATEMRTDEEIQTYADALREILKAEQQASQKVTSEGV